MPSIIDALAVCDGACLDGVGSASRIGVVIPATLLVILVVLVHPVDYIKLFEPLYNIFIYWYLCCICKVDKEGLVCYAYIAMTYTAYISWIRLSAV